MSSSKKQLHQIYKTEDGIVVPSVTQIINDNLGWNAEILIAWAASKARNGKDYKAIRDQAGHAGTLAHAMIETQLKWDVGMEADPADTSEFSEESIQQANRAFSAFLDWADDTSFNPLMMEKMLVSEQYKYGGTLDLIAEIGGVPTLVDFKTSSGIYPEHYIQLAAYLQLTKECLGIDLEPAILHLSKHRANYTFYQFPNGLENEWLIFSHLLEIDRLHTLVTN